MLKAPPFPWLIWVTVGLRTEPAYIQRLWKTSNTETSKQMIDFLQQACNTVCLTHSDNTLACATQSTQSPADAQKGKCWLWQRSNLFSLSSTLAVPLFPVFLFSQSYLSPCCLCLYICTLWVCMCTTNAIQISDGVLKTATGYSHSSSHPRCVCFLTN